jgi:exopolysaccharide biosynthesis WecB/TagA/CpsF family protein
MVDRGKCNVLGIRIDAVDYTAAVEKIIAAARASRPLAVSALAVHGVMTGVLDAEHRHRLNQFDLLVPDGQPVRWALNGLHRAKLKDRVYGPTLMLKTCERATAEGLPIFLYGGKAELLEALCANLLRRFPTLRIAGVTPSRFRRLSESERDDTIAVIRNSGAAITFVGLGCPRQEVWAFEMRQALSMPVLAVGAAFNFHAGQLPQAPGWLQARGLEWFYRLVQEPRRLWKRYLLLNPSYLTLFFLQLIGLFTPDPSCSSPPVEQIRHG